MKGADEGLADDGLEVFHRGVDQDIEHLGHHGLTELLKLVLGGVGTIVVKLQRLGLEAGHGAGYGREGSVWHWGCPFSEWGCGARRLDDRPAPTAGRAPQGL